VGGDSNMRHDCDVSLQYCLSIKLCYTDVPLHLILNFQLRLQTKLSYILATEHCLDLVAYFYIPARVLYSQSLVRDGPNQPLNLKALRSFEWSETLIHVLLI
jgi:hypothetical protein